MYVRMYNTFSSMCTNRSSTRQIFISCMEWCMRGCMSMKWSLTTILRFSFLSGCDKKFRRPSLVRRTYICTCNNGRYRSASFGCSRISSTHPYTGEGVSILTFGILRSIQWNLKIPPTTYKFKRMHQLDILTWSLLQFFLIISYTKFIIIPQKYFNRFEIHSLKINVQKFI